MKRFGCLVLVLVLLCGCAVADSAEKIIEKYNITASVLGAPELDYGNVIIDDLKYCFKVGYNVIIFEVVGNTVRTGAVYLYDESATADFLCSCGSMICLLGKMDITAFGMLMTNFCSLRAGDETIPYKIGSDAFNIIKPTSAVCAFIYMNNDLEINE